MMLGEARNVIKFQQLNKWFYEIMMPHVIKFCEFPITHFFYLSNK